MLSIGDFARLVGVSVRMLRHYDRLGLLVPARVDERSGYRFYTTEQLDRANRLVALKDLGFALPDVGELLATELTDARLEQLLRDRASQLRGQISADRHRLRQVEARLRTIEKERTMSSTSFTEQSLPELRLAQCSARVGELEDVGTAVGPLFDAVNEIIDSANLRRTGPGVAHYTADEGRLLVGAGEQIGDAETPKGLEPVTLAAESRAVTTTYVSDDLDGIQAAWQGLAKEVERRGLSPVGACREVYLETPMDPGGRRWVVDLQQPVA